jgi:hypothetical protein
MTTNQTQGTGSMFLNRLKQHAAVNQVETKPVETKVLV